MKFFWLRLAGIGFALSIGSFLAAAEPRATTRLNSPAHEPVSAAQAPAVPQPAEQKVTAYAFPPDLYRQAHTLGRIAFWGQLGAFLHSMIALLAPLFSDQ
jgi:hypothetical protein